MISPQLMEWLKQQKGTGQTRDVLYNQMIGQGYQPVDVNPALDEVFGGGDSWIKKNIFLVLTGILLVASALMFVYFLMSG